jgi:hypothetical protein
LYWVAAMISASCGNDFYFIIKINRIKPYSPAFKTGAFNRSATLPRGGMIPDSAIFRIVGAFHQVEYAASKFNFSRAIATFYMLR